MTAGGGPLLAPLAALGPALGWVQNPNYVAAPPSPDFLGSYGYAVLAGPGGLVASEALALGVLMLGPGIHYPTHRHPAVEIYVPLAGEAEWQKGEEPWRREPPGAVIRHEFDGAPCHPHPGGAAARRLSLAGRSRDSCADHRPTPDIPDHERALDDTRPISNR